MKMNYLYYTKIRPRMLAHTYKAVFKLADILGFWRYPSDRDPTEMSSKILTRMYWRYKAVRGPIVKAEKGSKLESYFAEMERQLVRPLIPEGFKSGIPIAISAGGDLMAAKGIENSKGKFYANIADLIFNADISIANLESPLTKTKFVDRTNWINLSATRKQFDSLKGHKGQKYTVFCTANNHIADGGMEGFNTTHDQLEAEGFFHVGTNRSPEVQNKALIITSNNVKFGFVAATYHLNNQASAIQNGVYHLVNVIPFHRFQGRVDVSLLEKEIFYCQSKGCDFIIASLHWGMEWELFPRKDQVEIAHHLVECGADAILSHHTHCIQPYELYQTRRDPHRVAPIFYGLGQLCALRQVPHSAMGLIANIDVVKGRLNGSSKTLVTSVNVTPIFQMRHDSKKPPYLQIEKLRNLIKTSRGESRSEYINQAGQYADIVLGRSWRN